MISFQSSVVSCFFLNLSCQHAHLDTYCALGVMGLVNCDHGCGDVCPKCTSILHDTFLVVSKRGLMRFFQKQRSRDEVTVNRVFPLVWTEQT